MITTTTPIVNLSDIKANTSVNFTFNVTNNSTNIVTLTTSATCGCTKPMLDVDKMGPLEMQYGRGTFKASSSLGPIRNKHITVSSNIGDSITIKLIGNVL